MGAINYSETRQNEGGVPMARCDQCGNDYDKAFQISMAGTTHTFDSFECAIQSLAPTCPHCKCRVIGHGVEASGTIYCCAHCASHDGATSLRDRAD
jgi:hypothetical protein